MNVNLLTELVENADKDFTLALVPADTLEKFAELIVRECINIVKQRWINPDEDVIAEEIKQHFGVDNKSDL